METGVRSHSKAYKCCKYLQYIVALMFGVVAVFFLIVHHKYTDQGTCFEDALIRTLANLPAPSTVTAKPNSTTVSNRQGSVVFEDDVLFIEVTPSLSTYQQGNFKAQYEFSPTASVLYLTEQQRKRHNFRELNVTIDGECLGYSLASLAGMDTVLINQLMYGLDSNALLRNKQTGELWSWNSFRINNDRRSKIKNSFGNWFVDRLAVSCLIFLFFAVMSGITAVVIRVLVSSGVVLVFPIFYALSLAGIQSLDLGIVIISYPWLGVEVGQLIRLSRSTCPYICAHLLFLLVLYIVFELSQVSFATVVYRRSYPAGLPLVVASGLMVLEYFSLVYIRSLASIQYFPKIVWLNFWLFHHYYYVTSYGFTYIAVSLCSLATLYAMMWFVTNVEVKALESGMISADLTRAKYATSAVPSWAGSLAPLYSVFQVVDGPFFPVTYEDVAGDGRNNNAEFYQLHQNEDAGAAERAPALANTDDDDGANAGDDTEVSGEGVDEGTGTV